MPNSGFDVLADHIVKLKVNEKRDKYLDFARELKKKLRNMKMTVIPIIIAAFYTVSKELIQGQADLERRV